MLDDRSLIAIRRRSYLEILDLGLLLVRRRPRPIAMAAMAGIAPFALLDAWLRAAEEIPRFAFLALVFWQIPLATAPLTLVMGDLLFGVRIRTRALIFRLARGLPKLILWGLVLKPLLYASILGIPLALVRLPYTVEVVLLERVPLTRFWSRAAALARGVEGDMVLRQVAAVMLGLAFVVCFSRGFVNLTAVFGGEDVSWDREPQAGLWNSILVQASTWIAVGFLGLTRFLTYIDRRIRLEGWDLELRLKAVARALAGQKE